MSTKKERILKHREEWRAKQQAKRDLRKANAKERAKRSNKEQLAYLDKRLGEGVGATKERARLNKMN